MLTCTSARVQRSSSVFLTFLLLAVFSLQEWWGYISLRRNTLRRCTSDSQQGRPSFRSTPCWTADPSGRISTCVDIRSTCPGSRWTSKQESSPWAKSWMRQTSPHCVSWKLALVFWCWCIFLLPCQKPLLVRVNALPDVYALCMLIMLQLFVPVSSACTT